MQIVPCCIQTIHQIISCSLHKCPISTLNAVYNLDHKLLPEIHIYPLHIYILTVLEETFWGENMHQGKLC